MLQKFLIENIDFDILDKKSKDVLILTHGLGGSKASSTSTALAKNSSITTIKMSLWGHGKSKGNIQDLTVSKAVKSVQKVIDEAKKNGAKNIYYYGSSFGGLVGYFIAQNKDVKKIFLKCPLASMPELISEEQRKLWEKQGKISVSGIKLNYAYFEDSKKHVAYDIASKIQTPVYIVHGDKDTTVPLTQSKKMLGLLPKAKLNVVNGANHRFAKEQHYNEMISLLTKEIQKTNER